jgi:hypothetical protein
MDVQSLRTPYHTLTLWCIMRGGGLLGMVELVFTGSIQVVGGCNDNTKCGRSLPLTAFARWCGPPSKEHVRSAIQFAVCRDDD